MFCFFSKVLSFVEIAEEQAIPISNRMRIFRNLAFNNWTYIDFIYHLQKTRNYKKLENRLEIDKKLESRLEIFEIFVNLEFIFEIFVNFESYFEFYVNFEVFLSMVHR